MSTWTFKGVLATLGLTVLAGCEDGSLPFGTPFDQATRAELADGAVTVAAPPGYCIDQQALRHGPRGDFVLLARCDTLGLRGVFPGRQLAVMTVTTAPRAGEGPPPSLEELQRSVRPARVIEAGQSGDLPLVRLDADGGAVEGAAPQHWRSAFALNGQLVALSLYAPESASAAPAAGADLLADLASRTRRASARPVKEAVPPADTGDPVQPVAEPGPEDTEQKRFSPLKLIGGLFD